MTTDRDRAARELLAFYREAGVDALVGETPVDRFSDQPPSGAPAPGAARPDAATVKASAGAATRAPRTRDLELKGRTGALPPPSPEAAVMAAREAARHAASLDELRAILDRFEGCALRATATQLVFADGNPQARVMFVGEAPGRDEGNLLDRILAAIGLDRRSVYIANIVPWRPPGNRDPSAQESAICLPFIRRQIELANPDVLVCLGKPSAVTLLDIKEGILKARGRWFTYHTGTRDIRATVTLHPAYLLRAYTPENRRMVWDDLQAARAKIDEA